MTEDELRATPYQIYVFDCPRCGGQTEIGDRDPDPTETCHDCDAEIEMAK